MKRYPIWIHTLTTLKTNKNKFKWRSYLTIHIIRTTETIKSYQIWTSGMKKPSHSMILNSTKTYRRWWKHQQHRSIKRHLNLEQVVSILLKCSHCKKITVPIYTQDLLVPQRIWSAHQEERYFRKCSLIKKKTVLIYTQDLQVPRRKWSAHLEIQT